MLNNAGRDGAAVMMAMFPVLHKDEEFEQKFSEYYDQYAAGFPDVSAATNTREKQSEYNSRIAKHTMQTRENLALQELNYRISVLETFQAFAKGAPMGMKVEDLSYHYQLVDTYVKSVLGERQFGPRRTPTARSAGKRPISPWRRWCRLGESSLPALHPVSPNSTARP